MGFPAQRLRRLRSSESMRGLVRENHLSASNFVLPLFAVPGNKVRREIESIPGNYQLSIDCLVEEALEARALGIPAILLFGVPKTRDELGSGSYGENGIVQEAVRAVKHEVPGIIVITDVCACEYTANGHCGSDMVAPAAMLDGQIEAIRNALDSHGFHNLPIMAYSAKFASKLYDPFFKDGTQSVVSLGDKRTHQMDFFNSDEAMREIALDIEEGADIVMVKPALFYLDIVYRAKQEFQMPLAAYDVSGEYAMIDAAARMGRLDRDAIMLEALSCMKRAGADIIITYFAKRAAELLQQNEHPAHSHIEYKAPEAQLSAIR